jgi:hypothetical protein
MEAHFGRLVPSADFRSFGLPALSNAEIQG